MSKKKTIKALMEIIRRTSKGLLLKDVFLIEKLKEKYEH
tara:strand:- start:46 stop:162 length:117 start_codon:yes stop_codon:yes gene_type:complete